MEVILNSDIARLVLGYLQDQNLHQVSAKYCKYSPYLCEEHELMKNGLVPISIKKRSLIDIVREYCIIESKVTKLIETFPLNIRDAFSKQNLPGKISHILKIARKNVIPPESKGIGIEQNAKKKRNRNASESSCNSSSSASKPKEFLQSTSKKRKVEASYWYLRNGHSSVDSEESISPESPKPVRRETVNPISINQPNFNQSEPSTFNHQQQEASSVLMYNQNNVNQPQTIIETPQPKSSVLFKCGSNLTNDYNLNQFASVMNSSDPNFSISKLFIMNPNESDSSLANTSNFQSCLSPFNGEQVFIDLGTGQTYPLVMSSDGVNCMVLNRNEVEQPNSDFSQQTNTVSIPNTQVDATKIPENEILPLTKDQMENCKNTFVNGEKIISASADSRKVCTQKSTPECSAIVTVPTVRSLTTPRRKSSHVRVLSFTPSKDITTNAVSNVASKKQEVVVIESVQIIPESKTLKPQSDVMIPEANVVQNVLVLPENDYSNSNSIEEQSNITVIQRKNSQSSIGPVETTFSKRVISELNSEDGKKNSNPPAELKKETAVKKSTKKKVPKKKTEEVLNCDNTDKEEYSLEAWRQMRKKTTSANFDQHLREITAKAPITIKKPTKRKKRRKIGSKANKSIDETSNINVDKKSPSKRKCDIKNLINFKIKTPIKYKNNSIFSKNRAIIKKEILNVGNVIVEKLDSTVPTEDLNNQNNIFETISKEELITDSYPEKTIEMKSDLSDVRMRKEMEKRTANIACILETPLKIEGLKFPNTPRFISSTDCVETPDTKMSLRSYSSLKHLDVHTPAFAITPGAGLTPFDKDTPKSGCLSGVQTDYSSGSSYYRPDESEDLDKIFDRNLNAVIRKTQLQVVEQSGGCADPYLVEISKGKNLLNESTESQAKIDNAQKETTNEEKDKLAKTDLDNFEQHNSLSKSSSYSSNSTSSSSSSNSSNSNTDKSMFENIESSEDENWNMQSDNAKTAEISQNVNNCDESHPNFNTLEKNNDPVIPNTILSPIKPLGKIAKIPNNSMMHIYNQQSQQSSELEKKRQRMKQLLANDFKDKPKKTRKLSPSNKVNLIFKNPVAAKPMKTKETSPTCTQRSQIEVLRALNLSAKKRGKEDEKANLPYLDDNATSDFCFEKMDDDDSQQSTAESLKIHNAALALTTMSLQRKNKQAVQIAPLPMKSMKLRSRTNKNVVKVKTLKVTTNKSPELAKIVKPKSNMLKHKSTMNKKKVVKEIKSIISDTKKHTISERNTIFENKVDTSTEKRNVNLKEKNKFITPASEIGLPIQISEIRSSVDEKATETKDKKLSSFIETQVSSATDNLDSEKEQLETNNLDDCENSEDEDPFELCRLTLADEQKIETYIYNSDSSVSLKPRENFNAKNSIMNINLDGNIYKLECTNEIPLYCWKGKSKTENRESKRNVKEETANIASTSTPIQPKIKILHNNKFFQGVTESSKTKSNTKSPRKASENSKTKNEVSSTKKNIRTEDIFAVLSHLHGTQEK